MQKWIDQHLLEQVESLRGLIRIQSVSQHECAEVGMPLGRGVSDALNYTLSLANRLGFPRTRSLDGYCGYVDYGDSGEMLMIMTHLDVVPAGAGWSCEPFGAELKDGKIYGRGAVDDKGPAIAALYALAAVKASGIPLSRRVRLLFGCDEERGMRCIERYKKTEELPALGFTPDGNYPLVNSEKGICRSVYTRRLCGSSIRIDCGVASNVIPGEAVAILPCPPTPCAAPAGFNVEFCGNAIRVVGHGGHASLPELAKNALLGLLAVLAKQPLPSADMDAVSALHGLFGMDLHGQGFGLDIADASGRLTLSPDVMRWDKDGILIALDCRYPSSCSFAKLTAALDRGLNKIGFVNTEREHTPGHFVSEESPLVKALLSVYEAHTGGAPAAPLAIGGGTYARAFPNTVAFGPEREDSVSLCHMPDECISVEDMRFHTAVFADAILKLAGS